MPGTSMPAPQWGLLSSLGPHQGTAVTQPAGEEQAGVRSSPRVTPAAGRPGLLPLLMARPSLVSRETELGVGVIWVFWTRAQGSVWPPPGTVLATCRSVLGTCCRHVARDRTLTAVERRVPARCREESGCPQQVTGDMGQGPGQCLAAASMRHPGVVAAV